MRISLIITTEFEKCLLKSGVQILFSVLSSTILNRYRDYRCTSGPRLPVARCPFPVLIMPAKDVHNYSTTKHYKQFKITTWQCFSIAFSHL